MMKSFLTKIVLTIGLLGTSHIASAAYFSSYIYEMGSERNFISKPVMNDTNNLNLYTVQAFKIDKPGKNGEHIIYEKDREIIYTPLSLKINPKSTDFFKLLYVGPKDNQERYYRVVFSEVPLTAFEERSEPQATAFVPTVVMSTIMIVRPRKQVFKYELDEKTGVLKNTGNTFFRVIVHQSCELDDASSTQFHMLPNEEYKGDIMKQKNSKFLVINQHYEQIGNQCEAASKAEQKQEQKDAQAKDSQLKEGQAQESQAKDSQPKDSQKPAEVK